MSNWLDCRDGPAPVVAGVRMGRIQRPAPALTDKGVPYKFLEALSEFVRTPSAQGCSAEGWKAFRRNGRVIVRKPSGEEVLLSSPVTAQVVRDFGHG